MYKTGIFHIYKRRRVVLKGGAIASQKISRYGTTIWPKTYFSGIEIKHVRMYNVSRLWETFWHEKVHSTMALKCKKYSAKTRYTSKPTFFRKWIPYFIGLFWAKGFEAILVNIFKKKEEKKNRICCSRLIFYRFLKHCVPLATFTMSSEKWLFANNDRPPIR